MNTVLLKSLAKTLRNIVGIETASDLPNPTVGLGRRGPDYYYEKFPVELRDGKYVRVGEVLTETIPPLESKLDLTTQNNPAPSTTSLGYLPPNKNGDCFPQSFVRQELFELGSRAPYYRWLPSKNEGSTGSDTAKPVKMGDTIVDKNGNPLGVALGEVDKNGNVPVCVGGVTLKSPWVVGGSGTISPRGIAANSVVVDEVQEKPISGSGFFSWADPYKPLQDSIFNSMGIPSGIINSYRNNWAENSNKSLKKYFELPTTFSQSYLNEVFSKDYTTFLADNELFYQHKSDTNKQPVIHTDEKGDPIAVTMNSKYRLYDYSVVSPPSLIMRTIS